MNSDAFRTYAKPEEAEVVPKPKRHDFAHRLHLILCTLGLHFWQKRKARKPQHLVPWQECAVCGLIQDREGWLLTPEEIHRRER